MLCCDIILSADVKYDYMVNIVMYKGIELCFYFLNLSCRSIASVATSITLLTIVQTSKNFVKFIYNTPFKGNFPNRYNSPHFYFLLGKM